jgi:tetratricopeptide (TPR) repeat protein
VDSAAGEEGVPAEARESYRQAMQAVEEGRAEEAVGGLKRALAVHPRYVRALSDLGVLYLRLNRLDEAAEALRRAIKLSKRFAYPRLNLGLVLNRQAKFSDAAEVLGPLYKESPGLKGVRAAYADALAGAGELAGAEAVLREAGAAADAGREERVEAHYKLGMVLSRAGRHADAAAELEKAVGLDERAANAHLLLGGVLLELKRLPEAERELLRAYELGGSEAGGAQLLLGQLYLSQQRLEPALRAYEQYLRDVPAAPNAEKIKEVLEKIRQALKKS